jgi:hypothetical protein
MTRPQAIITALAFCVIFSSPADESLRTFLLWALLMLGAAGVFVWMGFKKPATKNRRLYVVRRFIP